MKFDLLSPVLFVVNVELCDLLEAALIAEALFCNLFRAGPSANLLVSTSDPGL